MISLLGWTLLAVAMASLLSGVAIMVLPRSKPLTATAIPWLVLFPLLVAAAGAALALRDLDRAMAEEGSSLATIAGSMSRALMLSVVSLATVLACAVPGVLRLPKVEPRRGAMLPLLLVPLLIAVQYLFFECTISSLLRLPVYGLMALAVRRRGEPGLAILGTIMVAGEWATIGTAHFDIFTTIARVASGMDGMLEVVGLVAGGRILGLAVAGTALTAQLIRSDGPRPTWAVIPTAVAAAALADPTGRLIAMLEPVQ